MPRAQRDLGNVQAKFDSPELVHYARQLEDLRQSFEDSGEAVQAVALQEVEQEREVAVEAETVRYVPRIHTNYYYCYRKFNMLTIVRHRAVQKPPHREPLPHQDLDDALKRFCSEGVTKNRSLRCKPAFQFVRMTQLGTTYKISDSATKSSLFVTDDFTKTVKLPDTQRDDMYLRPVNWVLFSMTENVAIIVSPHEAELLLPMLRDSRDPRTYLLIYSAPVTSTMLCFDDLTFASIPSLPPTWSAPQWLRRDLGIFAGKLYFQYQDYNDLCRFLGLTHDFGGDAAADSQTVSAIAAGKLTEKPQQFLQQWLSLRRKGQDFTHTPMGFVIQGKPLDSTHIFFRGQESLPNEQQNRIQELDGSEPGSGEEQDLASDSERSDE